LQLAQGTVIAGRFRLVQALGRGGMGEVWLAHHTALDTPCAVKFIHAHVAAVAETRARFEREAKVIAQMRSPHVVQVLDYGECDGMPYIAMEYLEGEDLGRRLKRLGRLSPIDTYVVLAQVARALSKAHAAGLVHRDLKPENIFLVQDDEQELVKILDFGIAKSSVHTIAHGSTATGALLGTPSYMSPEQAQGTKAVDWRSDLWSLGVVAFRCITGRLPFVSDALGDLLVQIIVNQLPIPSQVAPDIPPRFDAWWQRAAARDPAQRFQSAKELIDALGIAFELSTAAQIGRTTSAPQPRPSGEGAPAQQNTPGSFAVPAATPGPSVHTPDPVAAPDADARRSQQIVAPTLMDSPEQQVHATVPGISHTMAGVRARRARVGVAFASAFTLGAVAAVAFLLLRPSTPSEAETAAAAPEAASASASAAPTAAPTAVASAVPSVEPAAPAPAETAAQKAQAAATSKPSAPSAKATSTPRPSSRPTTAPLPTVKPTGTYNPGI
jgi:serine/threonine-protein kinase